MLKTVRNLPLIWLILGSSVASASPADVDRLMYAGKTLEAVELAAREVEANTGSLEAQEQFIDLMLTLRLPNRVVPVYRQRAANNPLDPDSHYLVGRCVTDVNAARDAYEKALRLDPDHARSHMGIAAVHIALGHSADAEAAYRRALKLDASLSEAWQGLTKLLADTGRLDEALQTARLAMTAVPDTPDPYLTAALLSPGEAPALLATAVERVPQDPRTHAALAEVRLLTGDPAGALSSAEKALIIQPHLQSALLTRLFAEAMSRGVLDQRGYREMLSAQRMEQQRPADAKQRYDDLVARYPNCDLVWMARSRVRLSLKDVSGALADLDEALLRDAEDTEAHAARGMILARTGAPAEALPSLKIASAARPDDVSLAVALGEAAIAAGDVKGGTVVLGKAYSRFPFDVRAILAFAKCLSEQGEELAAYQVVRESVDRVPDARLLAALVAAAEDVGRYAEAATLLEQMGEGTGNPSLVEAARKLRALGEQRR